MTKTFKDIKGRTSSNATPRCRCGKYIGNSNFAGGNGRLSDAFRPGTLICEECFRKEVPQ